MTAKTFQEAIHKQPFQPFRLNLADGRAVPVDHPDWVAISPQSREVYIWYKDGRYEHIDLMLVIGMEYGNGKAQRKKRSPKVE